MYNDSQMTHMFFLIPTVNEYIINKDDNKQVQLLSKHPVHKIHESCRVIGYSKLHNNKFIMTIPSFEGFFRNVTISNSKFMITRSEVYV